MARILGPRRTRRGPTIGLGVARAGLAPRDLPRHPGRPHRPGGAAAGRGAGAEPPLRGRGALVPDPQPGSLLALADRASAVNLRPGGEPVEIGAGVDEDGRERRSLRGGAFAVRPRDAGRRAGARPRGALRGGASAPRARAPSRRSGGVLAVETALMTITEPEHRVDRPRSSGPASRRARPRPRPQRPRPSGRPRPRPARRSAPEPLDRRTAARPRARGSAAAAPARRILAGGAGGDARGRHRGSRGRRTPGGRLRDGGRRLPAGSSPPRPGAPPRARDRARPDALFGAAPRIPVGAAAGAVRRARRSRHRSTRSSATHRARRPPSPPARRTPTHRGPPPSRPRGSSRRPSGPPAPARPPRSRAPRARRS